MPGASASRRASTTPAVRSSAAASPSAADQACAAGQPLQAPTRTRRRDQPVSGCSGDRLEAITMAEGGQAPERRERGVETNHQRMAGDDALEGLAPHLARGLGSPVEGHRSARVAGKQGRQNGPVTDAGEVLARRMPGRTRCALACDRRPPPTGCPGRARCRTRSAPACRPAFAHPPAHVVERALPAFGRGGHLGVVHPERMFGCRHQHLGLVEHELARFVAQAADVVAVVVAEVVGEVVGEVVVAPPNLPKAGPSGCGGCRLPPVRA